MASSCKSRNLWIFGSGTAVLGSFVVGLVFSGTYGIGTIPRNPLPLPGFFDLAAASAASFAARALAAFWEASISA